jgi:type I restriction enzyme S subunit
MSAWRHENLGELCGLITDGKHGDCRNEDNSGYYFISCKDVKDGRINYGDARQIVHGDFAETHRRTNLTPGDILLTNSGTIGRLAIAPENDKTPRTTLQKSVAVLKPLPEKITSQFLYYSLASEKNRLINSAGGAAQKNLLLGELRRFSIRVPSLPEQNAITSILSAYDDLIENNRRRIQLLEQSARLLYKEWFVHLRFPGHEHVKIKACPGPRSGDGVPEGWEKKTLGVLCVEIRESVSPEMLEPDTPYIGLEHMPRRSISLSEWGTVEQVTSSKHRFRENEILFGKIRPYFHKVGITFTDGVASSDAIVIRPLNNVLLPIVLMTVSSDGFVAVTAQTMKEGSKMPRADWKQMQQYSVPLPPDSLLKLFYSLIEPITSQLKVLSFKNLKLEKARDLLLPRLMSGDISV